MDLEYAYVVACEPRVGEGLHPGPLLGTHRPSGPCGKAFLSIYPRELKKIHTSGTYRVCVKTAIFQFSPKGRPCGTELVNSWFSRGH